MTHPFQSHSSPRPEATLLPLAFATAALLVAGCGGSSSLAIESREAVIEPELSTTVYRLIDSNTLDIYLSDFPPESVLDRLSAGAPGDPGSIIHLHLFVSPKAGKTPIDFTASNASITYAVFTGSSLGVYGGGGFVLPSSDFGDARFTARIEDATIRLTQDSPGFADRLGRAQLSGSINAYRDDELATAISERLTRVLLR